ncbi:ligand-binding sensor domain-containing diguanylate cyclase [Halanaerobium saccharolyticum]|uniref:ligand-binding sensor domain-containing diguanylate cyclase n=1 Tax=Halanaerobium saccharolyticum TaxID=43595 RepID=UPI001416FAE2|nr:ligand-binding sensor domain-containing diguanylate cyclase [Halanaerobium saccharolyticum]
MIKYSKNFKGKNFFPHSTVTDILNRNNEELYLATDLGVVSYDFETQSFKELNILDNDYLVYSLTESDNRLWIGTYNNGLFSYNKNTEEIRQYKIGDITDNLIYDTLIDAQNRLWVATNNGLNLINLENSEIKQFYKEVNNLKQPASNTFRDLYLDSNNRVWIATIGGGVSYYNEDGTFTTYLEEDGLASNIVTGIAEDKDSKIWLATHSGISIIDSFSNSIFNLTPADGIGGWEFNTAYSSADKSGLLFGGNHGITFLTDDFSEKNSQSPPVYITDFQLFQKSVDKDRQIFNNQIYSFKADENYLSFEFVALNYDSPQNIKYYYKLDGFDDNWINAEDRYFSSYSNLKAGNYKFKVRAETIRGNLSQEAVLDFRIEKPWYLTLPAFILYILIFTAAVILIIKLRDSIIIHQKNQELETLNSKLAAANSELKEISTIDSLTKIYNRHYFNNKFKDLFALGKRSKTPLSLIIFDLDKFKSINDNYGHLVGDQVLKTAALRAKNILNRNTDFIARYGGDEFVIVLFDTEKSGAEQVISDVKKAIEKPMEIKLNGKNFDLQVKGSFGLKTIIPAADDNFNQTINLADQNLYKNKRNK